MGTVVMSGDAPRIVAGQDGKRIPTGTLAENDLVLWHVQPS